MHYDFDSQTIYLGEDGYNHYKQFGSGYYKFDINYKQKIPFYSKATIDYSIKDDISLGHNFQAFNRIYCNEPYITYALASKKFKLGYSIESQNINFGLYLKYISIEVSNNLSMDENVIGAKYHIKY